MFNYASLTKNGAALITRAVNGEKFVFTRMEYGNGIPSEFNASQTSEEIKSILSGRTSLVSKKADIGMYSISIKNNCATLKGKIINSSLTEDFLAKELGVFARIGEEAEVLVAYFIATESPDPINQAALVGQEHKIIVDVAIGNAADITIEYSPEVYATKEDFDALVAQNAEEHAALEQAIADMATSETITNIQQSITDEATARENADTALQSALAVRKSYDFVVDSNETLLAWANCKDGSMKSVLVKSGEYTLDGKMINLVNAGTKFVFAEDGNKITVSNYMRGIGAIEDYGAVIIGLNVEVNYTGAETCYAFYRGMICYNCTGDGYGDGYGTGTGGTAGYGYGFYKCTCSNCTGTGTGIGDGNKKGYGYGYGFYECSCSNCTGYGYGYGYGTGTGGTAGYGYGYGFYKCTCSNCTGTGTVLNADRVYYMIYGYGFYECSCSNCTGYGDSYGYGYGFYKCTCSNCTGTGTDSKNYGTGTGFYECSCSNCTGTGIGGENGGDGGTGYGFYKCTCSNCTGTGTGIGDGGKDYVNGYGFSDCKHCSSCRAGETASTTATWGGTNTYIDSDSCDYVAA